ncbi:MULTISPECIES: TlpA disulfide reductase family protein [Sphingobacterium]|uniref:TlpA disulfide reductase family protein n=1 Tax=Sphingobacterium TaxID=28453 RepID=UPI00257F4205|nr:MULTISPECIES: TlpA disulfide reductase family protein [Sphingobacterium]
MKNNLKQITIVKLSMILIGLLFFASLHAQEKAKLAVGSKLPPLRYAKWIKGKEIKEFKENHVYVFEFWATWCGPCVAAMPHLSELAKKYEGKATFIGANVWEKVGSKPYESSLPAVERFVNSSGDRMAYNVIADNNAQDISKTWLVPAGQEGIPTTFIVKNNIIQWIGHPMKIEEVINDIISGSFDPIAYQKKHEKEHSKEQEQREKISRIFKGVNAAAEAKDYDLAFKLIDEGVIELPVMKYALKFQKFKILLDNKAEADAMKYADELLKEDSSSYAAMLAVTITDKDGLSKEAYKKAAQLFEAEKQKVSMLFEKLALTYSKMGDYKMAVDAMEKAISKGQEELKDPNFQGRVFDYTIEEYKKKLVDYRSKL